MCCTRFLKLAAKQPEIWTNDRAVRKLGLIFDVTNCTAWHCKGSWKNTQFSRFLGRLEREMGEGGQNVENTSGSVVTHLQSQGEVES